MENLTDCNLSVVGALVLYCRKNNIELSEAMEKIYPYTSGEKDAKKWANGWENKVIVFTKKDYEEMVGCDCICIPSLKDDNYKEYLFSKIEKILAK